MFKHYMSINRNELSGCVLTENEYKKAEQISANLSIDDCRVATIIDEFDQWYTQLYDEGYDITTKQWKSMAQFNYSSCFKALMAHIYTATYNNHSSCAMISHTFNSCNVFNN